MNHPMEKADFFYLALVPLANPETSLVTRATAIIGKDLPGTQLLFAGKVPRLFARYDSREAAEAVAQGLTALGLRSILCPDSELRRPPGDFLVHSVEFGPGYVLFLDRKGQKREVKPPDAFLLIKGKTESYIIKEKTETGVKFSPGKAILTGGISPFRTEKKPVTEHSTVAEYFCRLYTPKSSQPVAEIVHNQVDYSFLKEEMAPASLANFNILVARLKQAFPGAIFDDNLMRVSIKQAYAPEDIAATEVNCLLLYLQYQLK